MKLSVSKQHLTFLLSSIVVLSTFLFLINFNHSQAQETSTKLIHVDRDSLAGAHNGDYKVVDPKNGDLLVRDHSYYGTNDEKFYIGLWEAKEGITNVPPLTYDEFFYVLEGSIELQEKNGESKSYSVGEAVVIHQGWSGKFIIPQGGVRKLYNVYMNDSAATGENPLFLSKDKLNSSTMGEFAPYEPEIGDLIARTNDYFYSQDENFGLGIWESKPGSQTYTDLGYHELMFIMEGTITMTDPDGTTQTFGAGEGIVLPKGYYGTLTVPQGGVRKIWTSYMGGSKG
jgi:uncharacterized cupin superfamily protein